MNRFSILTNADIERARITSINEKSVRIVHRGDKLYLPILPLHPNKVGHTAYRTRAAAEKIYDNTAALNKQRTLQAAGLI